MKSAASFFIAISVSFVPVSANATMPATVKKCDRLEIRSLEFFSDPLDPSAEPDLRLIRQQGDELIIVANGPVLGSMDKRDVQTEFSCTDKGLSLTATIIRSANFHGAVAKNSLWRPQIKVEILLLHPEAAFQTSWRMLLTNGKEETESQTPSLLKQKYPIHLTKILHSQP